MRNVSVSYVDKIRPVRPEFAVILKDSEGWYLMTLNQWLLATYSSVGNKWRGSIGQNIKFKMNNAPVLDKRLTRHDGQWCELGHLINGEGIENVAFFGLPNGMEWGSLRLIKRTKETEKFLNIEIKTQHKTSRKRTISDSQQTDKACFNDARLPLKKRKLSLNAATSTRNSVSHDARAASVRVPLYAVVQQEEVASMFFGASKLKTLRRPTVQDK